MPPPLPEASRARVGAVLRALAAMSVEELRNVAATFVEAGIVVDPAVLREVRVQLASVVREREAACEREELVREERDAAREALRIARAELLLARGRVEAEEARTGIVAEAEARALAEATREVAAAPVPGGEDRFHLIELE